MELSDKEVKSIVKNRERILSNAEKEENIIEWTTFY
jgi:hypothetical protein